MAWILTSTSPGAGVGILIELTVAVIDSASSTRAFIAALPGMLCVETRSGCEMEVACVQRSVLTASSLCIDSSRCKLVVRAPFGGWMTNARIIRIHDEAVDCRRGRSWSESIGCSWS